MWDLIVPAILENVGCAIIIDTPQVFIAGAIHPLVHISCLDTMAVSRRFTAIEEGPNKIFLLRLLLMASPAMSDIPFLRISCRVLFQCDPSMARGGGGFLPKMKILGNSAEI